MKNQTAAVSLFLAVTAHATWYVASKGGIVVFGEKNYPGRPDPDFPRD